MYKRKKAIKKVKKDAAKNAKGKPKKGVRRATVTATTAPPSNSVSPVKKTPSAVNADKVKETQDGLLDI